MFLGRFPVPALGGPMWLKHCKYCIRMRSPMLGKGSTLDQFWTAFGSLLGHFWHRLSLNGCPCGGLENHAILGFGFGSPCFTRVHAGQSRLGGGSALIRIISNLQCAQQTHLSAWRHGGGYICICENLWEKSTGNLCIVAQTRLAYTFRPQKMNKARYRCAYIRTSIPIYIYI